MFQFRRFPSYTYGFSIWYHNMTYGGLLHSVIPGSMSAYDSPRHFVVCHDLLRLPMPRHSLYALSRFTICFLVFFRVLLWCSYFCSFPDLISIHVVSYLLVVSSFHFAFFLFCFQAAFFSALFQEQISKDNDIYLLIYILECILFFLKTEI